MRVVIQRVAHASVTIEQQVKSKIEHGLLILLGIEHADNEEDVEWLVKKVANLRIFDDQEGVMNLSVKETGGDIIVVSQFTLQAHTKKGNRPSYINAAKHEQAIPLYHLFCQTLEQEIGKSVQTGEFGADMKVELLNDGPVTIFIDSKNKA